jgi:hypothetical protein
MPKSRGRRKGAISKTVRRAPRPPQPADLLLRDARAIVNFDDALTAELWASEWLGQAWLTAGLGQRDAEHQLCMAVTGRVSTTPSPHGLAAVAALARVAPADETAMLTGTIAILAQTQPEPSWSQAPAWTPVTAWRAIDVWDSERVLFVDFDGAHPHTLMAQLCQVGGLMVEKLAVLQPGAATAWDDLRGADELPMPIRTAPVADVLAELAHALRLTDMTWPRNDDDDFLDNRALAWSRCHHHLPDWPEPVELSEQQRGCLIDDFVANTGLNDDVSRSLAELFLDYGAGYIGSGPLAWSPGEVMVLLTDWLPRKAVLDADQRTALPDVLRRWVHFALTQHGIDPHWIGPVVAAVDTHLPDFHNAFDDESSWGPAKQIANILTERGIDLADRRAIDNAIHELNAEQLARRLLP